MGQKKIRSEHDVRSLISSIRGTIKDKGFTQREDLQKFAFGLESNAAQKELYDTFKAHTAAAIAKVTLGHEGASVDEALNTKIVDMATAIGAIASNPRGYTSSPKFKDVRVSGESRVIGADELGLDHLGNYADMGFEAFDGQYKDNAVTFSIIFNLAMQQQDEFGEAFYPTIALDPLALGGNISIDLSSIMREVTHTLAGDVNEASFGKRPVVKALMDSSVFGIAKNRIYPYSDMSNATSVLATIGGVASTFTADIGGETYTSAPLAFGKEINLIGVCQSPLQIAKGKAGHTDSLDRRLLIDKLFFSITGEVDDGSGGTEEITEIIAIPVGNYVGANFVGAPQGHNKSLTLNFKTESIGINFEKAKLYNGGESRILTELAKTDKVTAIVRVGLTGDANAQYGVIEVNKGAFSVVGYRRNSDGSTVSPSSAVTDVFDISGGKFVLAAYLPEAFTTNSDMRKDGQLITSDRFNFIYAVPPRTGVTVHASLVNDMGDDNDAARLTDQITFAGAFISMSAVQTLDNFAGFLKYSLANGVPTEVATGAGQFYVDATYIERELKLDDIINGVSSKDRDEDIRKGILAQIRDTVLQLWSTSNYGVAFRKATLNSGAKATVIIGTDDRTATYLGDGTAIDFGPNFDVKVVSTLNPIVAGKLYITFGIFGSDRNTNANPLNFGQLFYAPSIVTDAVKTIGSAQYRVLSTMPRYQHVNNLPVMAVMSVTGIESVIGKLAIDYNDVTP